MESFLRGVQQVCGAALGAIYSVGNLFRALFRRDP